MKYPDSEYLLTDFVGPEEIDIRCQTKKLVKVRKDQECWMVELHPIKAGEMALVDRAIVEGQWGVSYLCVPCMDAWLDHINKGSEFPPDNPPWNSTASTTSET